MASPYHMIEEKLEDAVAAVIASQTGGAVSGETISGGSFDGWGLFKGFSIADLSYPCICVICASSRPNETAIGVYSGNQRASVVVSVRGHRGDAATTRTAHAASAATIRDILYYDDQDAQGTGLVALLNASGVGDLTILRAKPVGSERRVESGVLVTDATLEVLAMPS